MGSSPTCTLSHQQTNHSLRKQPLTEYHWADNKHTQTQTHTHTKRTLVKSMLKSFSRLFPSIYSSALRTVWTVSRFASYSKAVCVFCSISAKTCQSHVEISMWSRSHSPERPQDLNSSKENENIISLPDIIKANQSVVKAWSSSQYAPSEHTFPM